MFTVKCDFASCFFFNFGREIIRTAVNIKRYSSVLNPELSAAIALGTSCVWDRFARKVARFYQL